MRERGVHPLRSADMSAEMKAAASVRKTASETTGTMTLNRSHLVIPVTTGRPESPESEGTLENVAEKLPESLVTIGTTET